jgi:hypothetical protein
MLARKSYPQEYVDATRTRLAELTSSFERLQSAGDFEPLCFNHMVLALDRCFVHRQRGMEGKDGNPLNEARVIADSLMENDGVLAVDNQIKLDPAKTVLGLEPGDEIALSAADFSRLAEAFLKEIEARYP